jgi:mono/diheme cytochrome c family protein
MSRSTFPFSIRFMSLMIMLAAGTRAADTVKRVPVSSTRADSGKQMFRTYCASCHGVDGMGKGPAAAAMRKPPPDLTRLTATNGGRFPADRVVHAISVEDTPAHGSQDMPVWGTVFRSMERSDSGMMKLRVANLTKYIESIQVK